MAEAVRRSVDAQIVRDWPAYLHRWEIERNEIILPQDGFRESPVTLPQVRYMLAAASDRAPARALDERRSSP